MYIHLTQVDLLSNLLKLKIRVGKVPLAALILYTSDGDLTCPFCIYEMLEHSPLSLFPSYASSNYTLLTLRSYIS